MVCRSTSALLKRKSTLVKSFVRKWWKYLMIWVPIDCGTQIHHKQDCGDSWISTFDYLMSRLKNCEMQGDSFYYWHYYGCQKGWRPVVLPFCAKHHVFLSTYKSIDRSTIQWADFIKKKKKNPNKRKTVLIIHLVTFYFQTQPAMPSRQYAKIPSWEMSFQAPAAQSSIK